MLNDAQLARVDLNLLILFDVVLRERHVGRAAERLNLSASAVSHGLRRLRRLLKDPLFLKTPRGVVPTDRAAALAEPVAEILARARAVIESAEPFDPATARRRFRIGAIDGISASFLPALFAGIKAAAPHIDIGVREVLAAVTGRPAERAWDHALIDLEARAYDAAVLPLREVPARFAWRTLYEEEFIIAMRAGHPSAKRLDMNEFCALEHLVVTLTADAHGFVDKLLAERGESRRVALTVPNFMQALAILAETDLVAALPRRLVGKYAERFGLASVEPPFPLRRDPIRAIVPKVAMMDAGVAWLMDMLTAAGGTPELPVRPNAPPSRRFRAIPRSP